MPVPCTHSHRDSCRNPVVCCGGDGWVLLKGCGPRCCQVLLLSIRCWLWGAIQLRGHVGLQRWRRLEQLDRHAPRPAPRSWHTAATPRKWHESRHSVADCQGCITCRVWCRCSSACDTVSADRLTRPASPSSCTCTCAVPECYVASDSRCHRAPHTPPGHLRQSTHIARAGGPTMRRAQHRWPSAMVARPRQGAEQLVSRMGTAHIKCERGRTLGQTGFYVRAGGGTPLVMARWYSTHE